MCTYIYCVLSLLTGTRAVRANISHLDSMFVSLRFATQQELVKAGVSITSLLDTLYDLPTLKKAQHREFLVKYEKHFEDCKSIEGVFLKLNTYWNYLNFDILAHFITKFSLRCLYSQLKAYEVEVGHFMERTTIQEYYKVEADKQKIKPPEGFVELVSEHHWEAPINLKQVENFRRMLAREYDLHECIVILVSMGRGEGMGMATVEEEHLTSE